MATPPRKRRLSQQARRALELLAGNPRGAAEDLLLLAHGFDRDMIAGLVYERLVTAKGESMKAGSGAIEVVRIVITEAGRRALEK